MLYRVAHLLYVPDSRRPRAKRPVRPAASSDRHSRRVGNLIAGVAMATPAAKMEPEPRLRTRAKVRPKAQLTLPEEIRQALHIGEGDEVEFAVHADGTVTIRGYVSIPTDQAWFFTPEWLAGEQLGRAHV